MCVASACASIASSVAWLRRLWGGYVDGADEGQRAVGGKIEDLSNKVADRVGKGPLGPLASAATRRGFSSAGLLQLYDLRGLFPVAEGARGIDATLDTEGHAVTEGLTTLVSLRSEVALCGGMARVASGQCSRAAVAGLSGKLAAGSKGASVQRPARLSSTYLMVIS